MFSNAMPASSIDCHQCVRFLRAHSTLLCFELTDRIIVICSLSSPEPFDPYKSLWGAKKVVNTAMCGPSPSCFVFSSYRRCGIRCEGILLSGMQLIRYEYFYWHPQIRAVQAHTWNWKTQIWFLWSESIPQPTVETQRFRSHSWVTLQRPSKLSSCFTDVYSASALSNRLSSNSICVLSLLTRCVQFYLRVGVFFCCSCSCHHRFFQR